MGPFLMHADELSRQEWCSASHVRCSDDEYLSIKDGDAVSVWDDLLAQH